MNWLLSILFGCSHSRTTFPLTLKRRTYVCCLDCGSEFAYDWRKMRRGVKIQPQGPGEIATNDAWAALSLGESTK